MRNDLSCSCWPCRHRSNSRPERVCSAYPVLTRVNGMALRRKLWPVLQQPDRDPLGLTTVLSVQEQHTRSEFANVYELDDPPADAELERAAEVWRPYRTARRDPMGVVVAG